ncbi:hypothetical protein MKW94_016137 [Papaver nudicaule]|uniref:Uncharacterized protein n=1 Tax=Papaver nudicaule TaxID=74823 RepID=A0AA41S8E2_PAPNU|nr:hypothetical protein [Papaver nudicaule]MCL7030330.1 hypothetical protein [Papaver nudicaule]
MPFPPCIDDGCRERGLKTWPQLLGKPAAKAKATIERDMPNVTAIVIPKELHVIQDFCCNRVWVAVNNDHQRTVAYVPRVG